MAVFPMLSRRATDDRDGLRRAYLLALRWLLMLALPIAVATTFLAEDLVGLLAGQEYLPQGAVALQVMIWFLPLSFANGLTQYVLLAMDRQRWITRSFVVAAAFNVVANYLVIPGHDFGWLQIPAYTYMGSAAVTIASELVLMVPFRRGLRSLDLPPLLVLLWRPALATSLMALVLSAAFEAGLPAGLALPLAAPAYLVALARLGGLTDDDRALLRRLLARLPLGAAPGAPEAPAVR
jgi:O-antigen/teichoic acid export membrane protein